MILRLLLSLLLAFPLSRDARASSLFEDDSNAPVEHGGSPGLRTRHQMGRTVTDADLEAGRDGAGIEAADKTKRAASEKKGPIIEHKLRNGVTIYQYDDMTEEDKRWYRITHSIPARVLKLTCWSGLLLMLAVLFFTANGLTFASNFAHLQGEDVTGEACAYGSVLASTVFTGLAGYRQYHLEKRAELEQKKAEDEQEMRAQIAAGQEQLQKERKEEYEKAELERKYELEKMRIESEQERIKLNAAKDTVIHELEQEIHIQKDKKNRAKQDRDNKAARIVTLAQKAQILKPYLEEDDGLDSKSARAAIKDLLSSINTDEIEECLKSATHVSYNEGVYPSPQSGLSSREQFSNRLGKKPNLLQAYSNADALTPRRSEYDRTANEQETKREESEEELETEDSMTEDTQ